jgi:hypothetical protein
VVTLVAVILACAAVWLIDTRVAPAQSYFDFGFGFTVCFVVFRFLSKIAAKALRPIAKSWIWIGVAVLAAFGVIYRFFGEYWLIGVLAGTAMIVRALLTPTRGDGQISETHQAQFGGALPDVPLAVTQEEQSNVLVALWDNLVYRVSLTGEHEKLEKALGVLRLRNEIAGEARSAYSRRRAWSRAEEEEDTADERVRADRFSALHSRKAAEVLSPLRSEIERVKAEAELATARKRLDDLKRQPQQEAKPSAEEERVRRHAASEAKLEKLRAAKAEAMKIADEDERVRRANAIEDAYQREMEEWAKSL